MNINLGTATAYLAVNADQVKTGSRQAQTSLDQVAGTIQEAWWGLNSIGLAASAAGAAVGASFLFAARAAIDWEDALAQVSRTNWDSTQSAEANSSALKELEQDLLAIARTKPTPSIEIAGIAELAGSLGVAREDVASFTGVVADLAATTNLTQEQAGEDLARIAALTGVTGDGFTNLASAVLEAGRSTIATETDITALGNRIARTGGAFGLSADEVVGWAAAVRSAGVQTQEGGTAIQKTFFDISRAVAAGGEDLETFAQLAGLSAEEFATLFQTDASQAVVRVIQGLGQMNQQGKNTILVLDELGITEARQVSALQALAQAETQTANENVRLSNILQLTNDAFQEGTALQEITARQYATTAAQIQIAKNQLNEIAVIIGQFFLPILQAANVLINHFTTGLREMSGPNRTLVTGLFAAEGVMLALLAAFTIFVPRLIQARQALAVLSGQTEIQTAANNRLADSAIRAGVAQGTAAGGSARLASGIRGTARGAGILGTILSVATVATTAFGFAQNNAADDAEEATAANQALTSAIQQQMSGVSQAADEWIVMQLQAADVIPVLQDLGFTLAQLIALIKGVSDAATTSRLREMVDNPPDVKGAEDAIQVLVDLRKQYRDSAKNAQQLNEVVGDQSRAFDNNTQSQKDNTEAIRRQQEAARRQYDAIEDVNNAIIDNIRAQAQAEGAALDLVSAQQAYQRALRDVGNELLHIQRAELELAAARLQAHLDTLRVSDAETKLARARQESARELARMERDRADALDRLRDAQERVREAEEALEKLRRGPDLLELEKAINRVAQAQLRLRRANMDVADAEWYLQHLREEGAGDRDIEKAELALEEAKQSVKDANLELSESQEELNDLQTVTPEELIDAQRELERALREVQNAEDDLYNLEQELADARRAHAQDRAYKEAELELIQARAQALNSILGISDAEQALAELRSGSLHVEAARAALAYRDAVFAVAEANAQVIKTQLEMQGQFVSSGRFAQILAGELDKMLNTVPADSSLNKLRTWRDTLFGATDPGRPPESGGGGGGGDGGGGGMLGFDWEGAKEEFEAGLDDFLKDTSEDTKKKTTTWRQTAIHWILTGAAGIIAGLFGGPWVGLAVAVITSNLLDSHDIPQKIDEWLQGTFRPLVNDLFEEAGELAVEAIHSVTGFREVAGRLFDRIFPRDAYTGFGSISGQRIGEIGRNVAIELSKLPASILDGATLIPIVGPIFEELLQGGIERFLDFKEEVQQTVSDLVSGVGDTLGGLPEKFSNPFGTIEGLLEDAGGLIDTIVPDGARRMVTSVAGSLARMLLDFVQMPIRILGALASFPGLLIQRGVQLIDGLISGVGIGTVQLMLNVLRLPINILNELFNVIQSIQWWRLGEQIIVGLLQGMVGFNPMPWISSIGKGIIDGFKSVFGIGSPSKVMMEIGEFTGEGYAIGLGNTKKDIEKASRQVSLAALSILTDLQALRELRELGVDFYSPVADRVVSAASAGTVITNNTVNEGDTYNIELGNGSDPRELMKELSWQRRLRKRGSTN